MGAQRLNTSEKRGLDRTRIPTDLAFQRPLFGLKFDTPGTLVPMEGFSLIIPCGLKGMQTTSVSAETGKNISVTELFKKLSPYFVI